MFGSLAYKDRVDWRSEYKDGDTVETLYQGGWHKGRVTGLGPNDLLKVTVLDGNEFVIFKDHLTTRGAVRKAS